MAAKPSDFEFSDDDSDSSMQWGPSQSSKDHGLTLTPIQPIKEEVEEPPSDVECMDVAVSPGAVYFDHGEDSNSMDSAELLLQEWFSDLNLHENHRRNISSTYYEIDPAYVFAQNRRLNFRGRALRHHRPKNKKSSSARGVVSMMNRAMKLPVGVNQIIRMNPKFNIQLENMGGTTSKDTDTISSSQYVLRQANHPLGKGTARSKDPCNPFTFPLRFETLEPEIVKNLERHWSNEIVVEIADVKHQISRSFDVSKFLSGDLDLDEYLMTEDVTVMVICGYLVSWKTVHCEEKKKICDSYSLSYLPEPMTWEDALNDFDILGMYDGTGKHGVFVYALPSSGIISSDIVNGLPCALRGFAVPGKGFVVLDVLWPMPPPSPWPTLPQRPEFDMIFVSGLGLSDRLYDTIEMDMFRDHLLGMLGGSYEQENLMLPRTKIVFVGNLFDLPSQHELSRNEFYKFKKTAAKLDDFLDSLANIMEVYVVPGSKDPTEKILPERPFQRMMLPKFTKRETAHRLHDPCRLKLVLDLDNPSDFLDVILSSGSNIEEIKKVVGDTASNPLIAENTLKWAHMNPAAPDIFQVNGQPQKDYFAICDTMPHLYVIGNQPCFDVREFQHTKILSLPNFCETHEAVSLTLVDGRYKIMPMVFKALTDDDFY